jgi:DNA-binding winged helix-turn-helix (wHTH) protein/Tol biopolymer transport system component
MSGRIRFGVYELDRDAMELRKHGVPIRLQEQPFRVLAMLAERPGKVITREELQEQIWGNTFVDFDQSLNKAVNRVREALNDNAGTPQYVETVPRRGYRFIAPVVASPQPEAEGPIVSVSSDPAPALAQPTYHRSRSRIVLITALTTVIVLAAIGITTVAWLRTHPRTDLPQARLVTSAGWGPVLSRDGKLLAYASVVGAGPPQIWVRQTAGGEAIRVSRGVDPEYNPDFSPDGTHIAFYSGKNGGGIYTASTLGGEPRLVVGVASDEASPRFSPGGETILYFQDNKAFTVSADGGQPVAFPLNQEFRLYSAPFWFFNGKEILFYGVRIREPNETASWWIAPLGPGIPRRAHLSGTEQNYQPRQSVRALIRNADHRDWIIYSTRDPESWKLWRVRVSPQGAVDQNPELLSGGNGALGEGGSAAEDGKLAYNIWNSSISIYQIPTGDRGQKLGSTLQLPLPEGGDYLSPSVSRDGKWMAYDSASPVGRNLILLRDLGASTEHLLDDKDRRPDDASATSISPDGSTVIFERDCKKARWPGVEAAMPCAFTVAATGGVPEPVCERCTPRGFSSDGSVVLIQKYDLTDMNKNRIVALDLRTRTERDFLSLPDRPVYHPFFSWDDRWVVFKKVPPGDSGDGQILIAPVRHGLTAAPKTEWIAVTDGRNNDDKPQFSPDGNTVYFTSTRDGSLCIWAQRLDPATKHPLGQPFAFEHFHNSAGRAAAFFGGSNLSVAHDKMLIDLMQVHSDIWMTKMP